MAMKLYSDSDISDIADAIRSKNGSSDTYKVSQMASAIQAIPTGGITPTGTKQISITQNGTTTEDVTNYASAEITTNVPASAVDTGTKNINSNGTHDVVGYASASVAVPNSYSASDEGKVVSSGALVAQTSDTVTQNGTVDTTLINSLTVNVSGGGGADLSWLASNTPTPSVLNFFYALANGTYEHGEFTLTNIPNNAFVDVFTVSNLTSPQGIMIIDKGFYQGITGLPHQSSEARTFMWGDKSFTNPAADATNKYETISTPANQTATSATTLGVGSFWIMDGTTETFRAYWQWSGKTLQLKGKYSNSNQYTPFLRNRPYIWIVW